MSRRPALVCLLMSAIVLSSLGGCPKDNLGEMQPYRPPRFTAKPKKPKKNYNQSLPPGTLALRKIGPEAYPDFSRGYAHRDRLEEAVQNSLAYLAKPSSRKYFPYGDITHERAVASLQMFLKVLREARTPAELDQLVRQHFEVYQSVGCDNEGTVFFTGYYCPIFEGRKQQNAVFRYPLYGLPPDLVKDAEGNALGRRKPDGAMVPYYTRREIEEGRMLEGTEVAWLKDPFEAYVATIQGSAKIKLEDGTMYELGYAGNNGYPYTPVADQMIADRAINRDELSLQTLMRYFAAHPDKISYYCWKNERFVFFREAPGGPYGSIGVPVIPYRSVATDKEVFPRACISFLDTNVPMTYGNEVRETAFAAFALDQDTGGAIRAGGRCDIFMGVGAGAEAIAGRTGAEGKFYYIFVKPEQMGVASR